MTKTKEVVADSYESLKLLAPSLTFEEDGKTRLKKAQMTLEALNHELNIKQPRKLKKQYKRKLNILNYVLNKMTCEWR